ncbi:hypothetical protein Tco_1472491, partial [Tanacetum coccineum]
LYDVRPSENDLIEHCDFIREAVKRTQHKMVGSAFTSSIAAYFACGHSGTANASVDNVDNTVVGNHGPSDQHAWMVSNAMHYSIRVVNRNRNQPGKTRISKAPLHFFFI